MYFFAHVFVFEIFLHELGHQVPAVRRRIDQAILGRSSDRTIQNNFERLIAGLVRLERKIIAIQYKTFGAIADDVNDFRQIDQILLLDFDQAQSARRILGQQRLDER